MHALQDAVQVLVDAADALLGRRAPRHEHDALDTLLVDDLDDALGEALPAAARVAVGLVRLHRQAGVEQQHAAVGPGRQQAAVARRRLEGRVVALDGRVDVLERRRGRRGRAHREAEPVRLVVVVVGVLAKDDDLDGVERRVAGPDFFGQPLALERWDSVPHQE